MGMTVWTDPYLVHMNMYTEVTPLLMPIHKYVSCPN